MFTLLVLDDEKVLKKDPFEKMKYYDNKNFNDW